MQTDPRHYEMLYIISADLPETNHKEVESFVKETLEKAKAVITLEENWGRKKLTYKIDGNTHGYYKLLEFKMPGVNFSLVNEKLRLSNRLLRYIIVKKEVKSEARIAKEKAVEKVIAEKKKTRKVTPSSKETSTRKPKPGAKKAQAGKEIDALLSK